MHKKRVYIELKFQQIGTVCNCTVYFFAPHQAATIPTQLMVLLRDISVQPTHIYTLDFQSSSHLWSITLCR